MDAHRVAKRYWKLSPFSTLINVALPRYWSTYYSIWPRLEAFIDWDLARVEPDDQIRRHFQLFVFFIIHYILNSARN